MVVDKKRTNLQVTVVKKSTGGVAAQRYDIFLEILGEGGRETSRKMGDKKAVRGLVPSTGVLSFRFQVWLSMLES